MELFCILTVVVTQICGSINIHNTVHQKESQQQQKAILHDNLKNRINNNKVSHSETVYLSHFLDVSELTHANLGRKGLNLKTIDWLTELTGRAKNKDWKSDTTEVSGSTGCSVLPQTLMSTCSFGCHRDSQDGQGGNCKQERWSDVRWQK